MVEFITLYINIATFTFSNQNLESYTASNYGSNYEILNYKFLPFRFPNNNIISYLKKKKTVIAQFSERKLGNQ